MTTEVRWSVTYPDTDNNNQLMMVPAKSLEHAQLLAERISQLQGTATIMSNETPPYNQVWLGGQIWMAKPLEFREEALSNMALIPIEDGTSRTIPVDDIRALLGYTSEQQDQPDEN